MPRADLFSDRLDYGERHGHPAFGQSQLLSYPPVGRLAGGSDPLLWSDFLQLADAASIGFFLAMSSKHSGPDSILTVLENVVLPYRRAGRRWEASGSGRDDQRARAPSPESPGLTDKIDNYPHEILEGAGDAQPLPVPGPWHEDFALLEELHLGNCKPLEKKGFSNYSRLCSRSMLWTRSCFSPPMPKSGQQPSDAISRPSAGPVPPLLGGDR